MRKYIFIFLLILSYPVYLLAAGVFGVDHPAKVFDVDAPDKVFGVEGLSSCCNTLTFVGDPGDEEKFECTTEHDACTTETTITDNDGVINSHDNAITPPSGYTYYVSHALTGADQNDSVVKIDLTSADAGCTFNIWIYIQDYTEDSAGSGIIYFTESNNINDKAFSITHYHQTGANNESLFFDGAAEADDTDYNMPADWYLLDIRFTQNDTCTVYVYDKDDLVTPEDTLTFTSNDKAIRYIWIGNFTAYVADNTTRVTGIRYKSGGGAI